MEETLPPKQETLAEVPPQKEKNDSEGELAQPVVRKEAAANSEGSVTRSKAKACSEESTDNSVEEQEPHSRKGRKSNKTIREQEAAREKAVGKQSNLDFLVKNSQASKYLLSAVEEIKEKWEILCIFLLFKIKYCNVHS